VNQNLDGGLTVVIPVFNESEALSVFVPRLLAYAKPRGWTVIFVDDASTDDSFDCLNQYSDEPSVRIVRHEVNRGYGSALKTGISAVHTEFVLTMDADGQHRPIDADELFGLLRQREADMVVGRRPPNSTSFYRWIAGRLMTLEIRDLNSGMKAYRTACAKRYLALCPDGMAFSDIITLVFIQRGYKVLERDIEIQPRLGGKSTVTTMTAVETVLEILIIVAILTPIRLFGQLGGFVLALYLLWGAFLHFPFDGEILWEWFLVGFGLSFSILAFWGYRVYPIRRSQKTHSTFGTSSAAISKKQKS